MIRTINTRALFYLREASLPRGVRLYHGNVLFGYWRGTRANFPDGISRVEPPGQNLPDRTSRKDPLRTEPSGQNLPDTTPPTQPPVHNPSDRTLQTECQSVTSYIHNYSEILYYYILKCYIAGDFNINLLNYESHVESEDFLNNVFSYFRGNVLTAP